MNRHCAFFRHDNEIRCLRIYVCFCVWLQDRENPTCEFSQNIPIYTSRPERNGPELLWGTYQHLPCVHFLRCSIAELYYFTTEHKSQNNYHIENVVQNDIFLNETYTVGPKSIWTAKQNISNRLASAKYFYTLHYIYC